MKQLLGLQLGLIGFSQHSEVPARGAYFILGLALEEPETVHVLSP